MARSSSIGSPLLNIVRKGDYRFSSMASKRPLTLPEIAVMSELSPRAWREVMTQPSAFVVTVLLSPLAEIPVGFLAKTTYSIMTSTERFVQLIEFSQVLASRLFVMEQRLGKKMVTKNRGEPVLLASTLPAIFPLDRLRGLRLQSAGFKAGR
jgi:hypothetical protein